MASTDRTSPLSYTPAPPPAEGGNNTVRATWDEFFQIAQCLVDLDKPAALQGSSAEPVIVGPTVQYDRLFDESDAIQYEQPQGQFDPATGIWTCPREGLYLILPVVEVPSFASPASKLFTASIRTTFVSAIGGTQQYISSAGGDDRVPLRIQPVFLRTMLRGDAVYFDLDLTHETKTGTVNVISVINIVRQSGIR